MQDAESYPRLIEAQEFAEAAAVLRKRLNDIDSSDPWPTAEEVFDRFSEKYGISFE